MRQSPLVSPFVLAGLLCPGIAPSRTTQEATAAEPSASPEVEGSKQVPGHQRMLDLLEKVRVESLVDNGYLGLAILDELRAELANPPGDADAVHRWQTRMRLGSELLRVGQTEESIEEYTRALSEMEALKDQLKRKDVSDAYFQLGTAYLRMGENQNCCLTNNKDSCILPIRGGGVHGNKEGSENAIEWFTRALENGIQDSPTYTKARWLLNVAYMTLGTYPDAVPAQYRIDPSVFASEEPFPHFEDIAPRVGLGYVDLAGGIIAEDFDGDGMLDIFVSTSNTAGSPHYYKNDGSGSFVDRSEAANLKGLYGGLNLIDGDYDNDGDIDILVLRGAWWKAEGCHPKSLLQNDGHGVFTDVTFEAGLGGSMFPTQTAAFGDYDNDGDLDLYIGNESDPSNSPPCELYRNDGSGRFTNVAAEANVTNDRYTKAVYWGDFDGDRYPDLYVSNMAAPNRLYHNNRDGTFTDIAMEAKVSLPISSFPCWFFDFDNDGALDIWVGGFGGPDTPPSLADVAASYLGLPHKGETMKLYKGNGRGGFRDVSVEQHLTRYTLPMGSNFGDLDNDGYLDIYLGTGYPFYEGLIPNVMYHNLRGKGFADVTTAGGFGELQKGHGIAFADLDNDGDQDVLERVGGAYPGDGYRCTLHENPGFDAHWLKLRVVGDTSNRCGIGVKIRLDITEDGKQRSVYKTVNSGGSFGCNPLRQEIGVGAAAVIDTLDVYWPTSDTHQLFHDVAADQAIEVHEQAKTYTKIELRRFDFAD
jgi:tetratricopeptide (TPR) repeat protein